MNPLYIVAVCMLSVLYAWSLYNIPILVAGVRRLRRSSRVGKRSPSLSKERLPFSSISIPTRLLKDIEKVMKGLEVQREHSS